MGEEGSAPLHLGSHPHLHCYLMGQKEGGRKAGSHKGLPRLTSCLTLEKGKISYAEFTASTQVEVGAGQDGSQLCGVDGFPLHAPLQHT